MLVPLGGGFRARVRGEARLALAAGARHPRDNLREAEDAAYRCSKTSTDSRSFEEDVRMFLITFLV